MLKYWVRIKWTNVMFLSLKMLAIMWQFDTEHTDGQQGRACATEVVCSFLHVRIVNPILRWPPDSFFFPQAANFYSCHSGRDVFKAKCSYNCLLWTLWFTADAFICTKKKLEDDQRTKRACIEYFSFHCSMLTHLM